MRYPPELRMDATFAAESAALPTRFPNPTLSVPRDSLISFQKSFEDLGKFMAALIGVDWKVMCTFHLLSFQREHEERLKKIADYEALIKKYAAAPDEHWTSGGSGYDPQSGWTGPVHGTSVRYPEAKALAKKWGLK